MSIKIHHGPAGSYKTSGAIQDDFIPAARAGRVIVTNIRGLNNRHKVYEALDGVPESFELHYLPTTDHDDAPKNREHLARFFHWLPIGALLIVDEAQLIFPKSWTEKDIKLLDYPGGVDAASRDKRPSGFRVAFDMHRHYNWDIIFTTTNIKKIRDDIRNVADMAYRHRDMAVIGWSGRYFETQHQPEDSGATSADQITVRTRKINPLVWGLYDSTATGKHSQTKSGLAFYRSPKVVFMFLCLFIICSFLFFNRDNIGLHESVTSVKKDIIVSNKDSSMDINAKANNVSNNNVPVIKDTTLYASNDLEPYKDYKIRIVGSSSYIDNGITKQHILFSVFNEQETIHLSIIDFSAAGYGVLVNSSCSVTLLYHYQRRYVSCSKIHDHKNDFVASIIDGRPTTSEVRASRRPDNQVFSANNVPINSDAEQ